MTDVIEYVNNNLLILDGGMGTLLQADGLLPGELPERWNISHPEVIRRIHLDYYNSGSNVVSTNTFGANRLKYSSSELKAVISSAVENAKFARECAKGDTLRWIALDIGPTGKMLKPYGELAFEDAVEIFAETVRLGVECGVDLIFIETMSDSLETKAALLAAKENSDLPVFVSCAYGEDGKLLTGATPAAMVAMLEGMGADAIGVNCSFGPEALISIVKDYLKYSSLPIIVKPNAGLPTSVDGRSVYDLTPERFAEVMKEIASLGATVLGGCCGTTPEYISALSSAVSSVRFVKNSKKNITAVSSYTHAVVFDGSPVLIGERINPTGKKKLREALLAGNMDYLLREGIAEEESGAHILDVNVGLPELDEVKMLTDAVTELQSVIDLPLEIDTSSPEALAAALRVYNGKAMINSVNGKAESMNSVFPLARKYGGVIVALTLDESGMPESAEGRLAIAERILAEAEKWGIEKKDIIFDPLALTVSADSRAALETLRAVKLIREKLGAHTSLGVSNVSFGLPKRDIINSAFFTMALFCGLSAAIINPHSHEMMKAYHAYRALMGLDEGCREYIDFAESFEESNGEGARSKTAAEQGDMTLSSAIERGLKEQAVRMTHELLSVKASLDIVNDDIIPALNSVGEGFEKKTVYLPGLLMSAEAAGAAFEVIKAASSSTSPKSKCKVVLATVKGDIHDIGKNIVKLLLENYGFDCIDLGRDVAPETVVEAVKKHQAKIVGLSALMTTTVPAMESTVELLRREAPFCKVIVGGAVLTEEYARSIGADFYASDAMAGVRIAEEIFSKL